MAICKVFANIFEVTEGKIHAYQSFAHVCAAVLMLQYRWLLQRMRIKKQAKNSGGKKVISVKEN